MPTSPLFCHFTPFDTWFFRESRPHGSVGSSELGSVFPPPVRTLAGALRTLIGDTWHERHGGNWRNFSKDSELAKVIGFGDDLGPWRLEGPFITLKGKRLYPAPANLMSKQQGHERIYFLLELGKPVHCDLGKVHLPQFPAKVPGLQELAGSAPVEGGWLTEAGMQAVLNGQPPQPTDVITTSALFAQEPRLGIGRDNSRKSVQEGLLYQTRHLRLHADVGIALHLHNLQDPDLLPASAVIRLGGEGRQAALEVRPDTSSSPLVAKTLPAQSSRASLYALTPMPCTEGLPAGIPPGFQALETSEGVRIWRGELHGQRLHILSVTCPRVLREGGWDLASHSARPVQSLLAPGSVLYVETADGSPINAHALAPSADAMGRSQFLLGAPAVSAV